jgi:hypothetical protein
VGLGATSADATFFVLTYHGVLRVVPSGRVLGLLALAGVCLMEFFAYGAWTAARKPLVASDQRLGGWPGGFLIAITSPINLAWWLTAGAPYLARYGFGLAFGFFPALLGSIAVAVLVFRLGAQKIAGFERWVSYASALLLSALSLLLAYQAAGYLLGP